MSKKVLALACVALVLCVIFVTVSHAAEEREGLGAKMKRAWQKLFGYPANVAEQSAGVVVDTGKRGTAVVAREVKTVGQVTTGEFDKTKDLITEPITGTAETAVKAVEETAQVPFEAAKEEEMPAEEK